MEERARSGDEAGAFRSFSYVTGGQEEAAFFAGLRQRFGDEAVDQMLRSRELAPAEVGRRFRERPRD